MMTAPVPIDIVLVGDLVPEGVSRPTLFDWDNPTWPEAEQLVQWFVMTGRRAEIVPSVTAFVASAAEHSNKLVFPLWRGGASRNRTAIVPAVCEAHGLLYVGADAFSQSVCQDKSLSKHVLNTVGIDTPPDVVFNGPTLDPAGFAALEQLRFPVVVKPLSSACSIGVTDASLCVDAAAAAARARVLIEQGLGPVICEPFVAGDEISLCIVETGGRIGLHCVAAHRTNAGTCPFRDRLFTHDEKISPDRSWRIAAYSGTIADDLWSKAEALITRLGPFGLLRIDGKIADGRFTAIELTPDIHLGLDSAFLGGFNAAGIAPSTVLEAVVAASLQNNDPGGPPAGEGQDGPPATPPLFAAADSA